MEDVPVAPTVRVSRTIAVSGQSILDELNVLQVVAYRCAIGIGSSADYYSLQVCGTDVVMHCVTGATMNPPPGSGFFGSALCWHLLPGYVTMSENISELLYAGKDVMKMLANRREVELLEKNKPRQERAKRTYEAILVAAAELLVEVGVERISTNLIAERAGITVPALYRYFPNKYAVLNALGAVLMDRQNEVFQQWFDAYMGEDGL